MLDCNDAKEHQEESNSCEKYLEQTMQQAVIYELSSEQEASKHDCPQHNQGESKDTLGKDQESLQICLWASL